MLLQRLKYKLRFITGVRNGISKLFANIHLDSRNIIAWTISFIALCLVTYNSFQSISEWSKKYKDISQEAKDYEDLKEKKKTLENELRLLEDNGYTRIKASDSNLTNKGDTIYRIIGSNDNTYEGLEPKETDNKVKYIPEKGSRVWLDLISD